VRRLDRYILKEMFTPMLVGTLVIALLFMANEFISIFRNFEVTRLPFTAITQMVLFRMPFWLSFTLPSGTAIGVALAISRLARESEITAMRAAGLSLRRIFMPIVLVGLAVGAANFFIVEELIPPAAKAYKNVTNKASVLGSAPAFKSNVMLQLDQYTANFGEVQRLKDGEVYLKDAVIFERPKVGETWLYTAPEGSYKDGVWDFPGSQVYRLSGIQLMAGESQHLVINQVIRVGDLFVQPEPEESTADDLRAAIKRGKANKIDTTSLEVAYYVKYSLPASCLVFALTSAAFAVAMMRSGPFVGLIVSMGLVMLFYNAHIVSTEIIGRKGWLPPMFSAWLPDLLYTVVAVILIWRSE
jgi:lipopolysaccharide export system permease protein